MVVKVLCYEQQKNIMRLKGSLIFDLENEEQRKLYIKELTEFTNKQAYQLERYEEK